MSNNIHSTSIIDEGAIIGNSTKIWHWSHICAEAKIGEKCSIGQNVFIANKVIIGNNVKIQNNVSVYDCVTIEDDVFCGPSMVFTNVYNPRSFITRKNEYKSTLIKRGASLGANCTIVCGVTIGEYAFIAAGCVVNKDVKPYALIAGVPGKQIGWMSKYGEKLNIKIGEEGKVICEKSKEVYFIKNGECNILL